MNRISLLTFVAALLLAPLPIVLADQPPRGAKPLSELAKLLEEQGYGPFVELSFDDEKLEVEAYKQQTVYELDVDPRNGKVLSEEREDDDEPRPPQDAKPLSEILAGLEKNGYSKLHDVSFERRYWEIDAISSEGKRELHVDPKTGEVTRDRADD